MGARPRYYHIVNWDKYQGSWDRTKKGSRAWVKSHTNMLSSPDYLSLQDNEHRLLMRELVDLAAERDGKIPGDLDWLLTRVSVGTGYDPIETKQGPRRNSSANRPRLYRDPDSARKRLKSGLKKLIGIGFIATQPANNPRPTRDTPATNPRPTRDTPATNPRPTRDTKSAVSPCSVEGQTPKQKEEKEEKEVSSRKGEETSNGVQGNGTRGSPPALGGGHSPRFEEGSKSTAPESDAPVEPSPPTERPPIPEDVKQQLANVTGIRPMPTIPTDEEYADEQRRKTELARRAAAGEL